MTGYLRQNLQYREKGGELRGNGGKIMSFRCFCSVDTKLSKTKPKYWVFEFIAQGKDGS